MSRERIFDYTSRRNKLLLVLIGFLLLGGIIWWITNTIKENHLQSDPMLYKLRKILEPLHPDIQHVKLYKGKKSYTINKEKIYLCLTDKNGDYYPINHLLYVFLHEYAHYLNKDDIGHTEKFHKIFEDLLDQAHKMGLYNPSIPPIEDYCNY